MILTKALENNLEYVKSHWHEFETVDHNQRNILHYAVIGNAIDVIKYILSCDFNVNATDIYGETPLFDCARKGKIEIASLLIHHHASVFILNNKKESLLHLAALKGDIKNIKLYLESNLSINQFTNDDKLPIHYAIQGGRVEAFEYLLNVSGLKYNYTDIHGNTFLHYATKTSSVEMIKSCLNFKMNVNFLNDQFETPIFNAVKFGTVETVKILMEHDAYLELKNRRFETIFDIAKIHEKEDILNLLNEYIILPKYERLVKKQQLSIATLNRDHHLVRKYIENEVPLKKDKFLLDAYDYAKIYNFQNILNLLKVYRNK